MDNLVLEKVKEDAFRGSMKRKCESKCKSFGFYLNPSEAGGALVFKQIW